MPRLEEAMRVIGIALVCAVVAWATPGVGSAATETDHKRVGFTVVEDMEAKSPKANETVFFAYYDSAMGKWQENSHSTDSAGKCSFDVPTGSEGESLVFVFAMTQEELDKATQAASAGKRLAWRIPPGDQPALELLTDGSRVSNTEGTMQMWGVR